MTTEATTKKATDLELVIKNVRLSFPSLFSPKERKNDAGDVTGYLYEATGLIPKDHPQFEEIKRAMIGALLAKWPDAATRPSIPADRRFFRDGEVEDPDTSERTPRYDGYAGHWSISANKGVPTKDSPNPVQLLDGVKKDGKFVRLTEADGKLYGGCYVDMIIRVYAYDGTKNRHPCRINASLEAVKFRAHGEAFGARPVDADNLFEENEVDDDGFGSAPATASASASDDLDDLMG